MTETPVGYGHDGRTLTRKVGMGLGLTDAQSLGGELAAIGDRDLRARATCAG
jgi:hypothetical protein